MPYRPVKLLFVFLIGLSLVPVMALAPEGVSRDAGCAIPILLWLVLLPLALFLTHRQKTSNPPHNSSREPKRLPYMVPPKRNRFCLADAFALAYLVWLIVSLSVLGSRDAGNWRYALNAFSLYFFLGYLYFLVRILRPVLSPTLLLCLFGGIALMGMTEAFSAIYAYEYRDPAFRQAWLENPDELLRSSGMYFPEGSAERILLENRILGSTEPLGTYGLANTLAGVILPILVAAVCISCFLLFALLRRDPDESEDANVKETGRKTLFVALVAVTLFCLPLFFVLILTKSRTSMLAFIFGCAIFLPVCSLRRHSTGTNRRVRSVHVFLTGIALMIVVSLTMALRFDIVDREVFTEAGKSLGYRLDYWRSSAKIVADYPLAGIGPGNFQTRYPSYIMPNASEIIADPHNFVFELSAIFGIPALLCYLAFFLSAYVIPLFLPVRPGLWAMGEQTQPDPLPAIPGHRELRSKQRQARSIPLSKSGNEQHDANSATVRPETESRFFFSGLAAGLPLTFFFSYFTAAPLGFSFVVSGIIAYLLFVPLFSAGLYPIMERWSRNPETFRSILRTVSLCSCAAIMLNLCAAGGFSYLPIAFPLWLFAGVLVNDSLGDGNGTAEKADSSTGPARIPVSWLIAASCIVPLIFYLFVFAPARRGAIFTQTLRDEIIRNNRYSPDILDGWPKNMKAADFYSIPLGQVFFETAALLYAQSPNDRTCEKWRETRAHYLAISPHSSATCELVGEKEFELYKIFRTDKLLLSSSEALKDAVRLAPRDAKKHGLCALALDALGKKDEAIRFGRQALELDEATPHLDRKLKPSLRKEVETIVRQATDAPTT